MPPISAKCVGWAIGFLRQGTQGYTRVHGACARVNFLGTIQLFDDVFR